MMMSMIFFFDDGGDDGGGDDKDRDLDKDGDVCGMGGPDGVMR